jgi:hypothetical protein
MCGSQRYSYCPRSVAGQLHQGREYLLFVELLFQHLSLDPMGVDLPYEATQQQFERLVCASMVRNNETVLTIRSAI